MSRETLDGWDEIGDHLGVTGRTAQEWEKTGRLPVRRKPGGTKPRVFAFADELDEWKANRSTQPEPKPKKSRMWLVAAGIVAVLAASAFWYATRPGPPANWRVNGTTLEVLDDQGRTCWTKPFPNLLASAYREISPNRHGFLRDIDEDSQAELVFSYLPQGIRDTTSGTLICYETNGREEWRLDYGAPKNYGDREFPPLYEARILDTIHTLGKLHILLVATHGSFPARVLLLDPIDGSIVQEYWHPGHLSTHIKLDLDDDGEEELVLGGVNNPGHGLGHPALVVLDFPLKKPPDGLPGHFPVEFTGGGEAAYYLLPRPDTADALNLVFGIDPIQYTNGQFELRVAADRLGYIDYHLTKNFEIIGAWPSNTYLAERSKLEREGNLKPLDATTLERIISFPTAPDANHPAIQEMFESPRPD